MGSGLKIFSSITKANTQTLAKNFAGGASNHFAKLSTLANSTVKQLKTKFNNATDTSAREPSKRAILWNQVKVANAASKTARTNKKTIQRELKSLSHETAKVVSGQEDTATEKADTIKSKIEALKSARNERTDAKTNVAKARQEYQKQLRLDTVTALSNGAARVQNTGKAFVDMTVKAGGASLKKIKSVTVSSVKRGTKSVNSMKDSAKGKYKNYQNSRPINKLKRELSELKAEIKTLQSQLSDTSL